MPHSVHGDGEQEQEEQEPSADDFEDNVAASEFTLGNEGEEIDVAPARFHVALSVYQFARSNVSTTQKHSFALFHD
jgi:hypothetical protein